MCHLGEALVMETWEKAVRETRKENKKKIMEASKRAKPWRRGQIRHSFVNIRFKSNLKILINMNGMMAGSKDGGMEKTVPVEIGFV